MFPGLEVEKEENRGVMKNLRNLKTSKEDQTLQHNKARKLRRALRRSRSLNKSRRKMTNPEGSPLVLFFPKKITLFQSFILILCRVISILASLLKCVQRIRYLSRNSLTLCL